jgi:Predicted flavoprotein involved in K+ transport
MTAAHYDTVIIGAGLSGIGAACHIASEFPHRTMAILERREKMGGTWDLFRYPGIRSDSDMASFGFNFKPWYSDQVLAKGSDIRDYVVENRAGVPPGRQGAVRPEPRTVRTGPARSSSGPSRRGMKPPGKRGPSPVISW